MSCDSIPIYLNDLDLYRKILRVENSETENPILIGVEWCEKYIRNIELKRKQMREDSRLFYFLRPIE